MPKLLVNALMLAVAICLLGSDASIQVRGSRTIRYDPTNPSPSVLICEDESGESIRDASWFMNKKYVTSTLKNKNHPWLLTRPSDFSYLCCKVFNKTKIIPHVTEFHEESCEA